MITAYCISLGSISDDEVDGDNEPLPDFLLPEYSKDKVHRLWFQNNTSFKFQQYLLD